MTAKPAPSALRLLRALPLICTLLPGVSAVAAEGPPPRPAAKPVATATAPAGKSATKPATRPAPRPATARQQLKNEAEGLALATTTAEAIDQAQLDVAARVLTGTADCEFNQQITIQPVEGLPGHFSVGHKGQRYTMVPEETATGAVRLMDRRAGVVWLQIPTKSMLMNSKLGQRMVDGCQQAEQRVAVSAASAAATSLGILPGAAAVVPADAAAAASAPSGAASASASALSGAVSASAPTGAAVETAPTGAAAASAPASMPR